MIQCLLHRFCTTNVILQCFTIHFLKINPPGGQLNTLVRKLKLRTMEVLWEKLGELCDRFFSQECKKYRRHAVYKTNNVQTVF